MCSQVISQSSFKCELYYTQPPQANLQIAISSADIMKEEVLKSTTKFKLVQTKVYQINSLLQGLSTFVPVSFDCEYTSICLCTLHGSIIYFRFNEHGRCLFL